MLENRFKDVLKEELGKSYKYLMFDKVVQGPMTGSGRPDLDVIGSQSLDEPGHEVRIETKIKQNKLSPKQRYRMLMICNAGGTAVCARLSKDEQTVIWSTVTDEVFAETPLRDCGGVLEKCQKACRETRANGGFEDYEIPLSE